MAAYKKRNGKVDQRMRHIRRQQDLSGWTLHVSKSSRKLVGCHAGAESCTCAGKVSVRFVQVSSATKSVRSVRHYPLISFVTLANSFGATEKARLYPAGLDFYLRLCRIDPRLAWHLKLLHTPGPAEKSGDSG